MIDTNERVSELMRERKLSLLKLSSICNVPYTTLQTARLRDCQLSVDTIERICHGLNISMSEFFSGS